MLRHELVIPRAAFEAALTDLTHTRSRLTSAAGPRAIEALATGQALLLDASREALWVAQDITVAQSIAAPQWPRRFSSNWSDSLASERALFVLALASAPPPSGAVPWRVWWRDAVQRIPVLRAWDGRRALFLGLDDEGRAGGALRLDETWLPLDALRLPGPGMLRIALASEGASADAMARSEDLARGRYSRIAGALSTEVLQRMQHSVFGIIGAGRTGSALAHTLARNGASLLLIDPDVVEAHNLDGDGMLPAHEGLAKVEALARALRPCLRPGAWIGARRLDLSSPIAGRLLGEAHVAVSAVDNDLARLWALAWAQVWRMPHLDVASAVPLAGDIGADIRLTLPGEGCLACVGGLAGGRGLHDEMTAPRARGDDFRRERRGSLRSIGVTAAHVGVRLLEQLYSGQATTHRFVRLVEDAESGALSIEDRRIAASPGCAVCEGLSGVGPGELSRELLASLAARLAGVSRVLT